ncbi:MAG: UDP-N-acetylglucosamine--N-acetylmuramyl-(pentapeptide) pyrophosphoryl-undecaprenol N-acetylglucosamine transferase [Patescibacteria group bacterium]|nr:UDP-N-acetylglucosamine--N-acetylmuramyl-(pentapeptide) pyrophosphoryl-undecaprenol N-acetylglucosamine transferase [Patescibacteria group bacterium]
MNTDKDYKFLITGGHLTPALATIEELRSRGYTQFFWFGRKKTMTGDKNYSAEYEVVYKDLNIPFEDIVTGKIVRFKSVSSFISFLINIVKIPIGIIQSLFLLLKDRPTVIVSFGGYIAVPVVIAGWLLRIPIITHEQTVVTGIANKVVAKFAKKVLISWQESSGYFDKRKVIVSGNPVRKEIFNMTTDIYRVNEKLKTIYITGGNQGAHIINQNVLEIVEELLKSFNVIHQTGLTTVTRDFERCEKLEKSLTGRTKGTYIVRGSTYGPQIGEIFTKADLIVSRSGANICSDILALGKLAVLIPIPWTNQNEQFLNAKMLESLGVSIIIEEKDLTPNTLKDSIRKAMKNISKGKDFNNLNLKETEKKAKEKINLRAAEIIADVVIKMVRKK